MLEDSCRAARTRKRRRERHADGRSREEVRVGVYLIDGYNVLHQFLGHQSVEDLEDQRNHLIDRIASFMGGTSDRAIIVFYSKVQTLQKSESATRNVEVYFGSFSRSADSIIEREVFALSAGQNVVVVSSDYNLQKTIFRPNVIRRSARQFIEDLQIHTKRIANPENCITMGHRIEDRVDSKTADRLKALRQQLTEDADK